MLKYDNTQCESLPSGWNVVGETTVLGVGELKGLPIELIPDDSGR